MRVDTTNWTGFGRSSNADFYQIDAATLAVVPFDGCTDDETTVTASVELQLKFLRTNKKNAASIIFMDGIVQQTAGARTVYRELPDPEYQVCYALVGGTAFGRVVGSVFLGLSKPRVPTQMYGTLEQSMTWCQSQIKKS